TSIIGRQQDAVLAIRGRRDDARRGRVRGRVNVVPVHADERIALPARVPVGVQDVLPVLVVVVTVGQLHVFRGTGGRGLEHVVVARRARPGIDVGGDREIRRVVHVTRPPVHVVRRYDAV